MPEVPAQIARPSPAEPVPDEFDLLCERCGYSLIGLSSDQCPECGTRFNPNDLPLARVPWLYRARLGRVKAYARTIRAILSHPAAFAAEICRPVRISAADALSFRRFTIRIVWWLGAFALAAWLAAAVSWDVQRVGGWQRIPRRQMLEMLVIGVASCGLLVGLWVFLWLATDLPTFIWRGLPANPRDLAPLHHYACAPLVLIPAAAVAGAVVLIVS
jgi:hypothetical protein